MYLIDFGIMEWNATLVLESFNELDANVILVVPLSEGFQVISMCWALSKYWVYSVKTAYMVGKLGNLDMFYIECAKLWGLHVSPRVRYFLWRACFLTLSLRSLLKF